jgi:hypothetical protein
MPREILPLEAEAIPELSQFLTGGFHAAPDAEFAAPDVLRWKYFEPRGTFPGPRSLVIREEKRIIAHVGVFPTTFEVADEPHRQVTTLHMTDWLGSPAHGAVGTSLMRHTHGMAETQYVVGATASARKVLARSGYEQMLGIPVYRRVVRPTYRFRAGERGMGEGLRFARDMVRSWMNRRSQPGTRLERRRVDQFGAEVMPLLESCERPLVFTGRSPEILNHYLAYPRGEVSGWLFAGQGRVCGIGLLYVATRGPVRSGRIIDCFLPQRTPEVWHAAVAELTSELEQNGVDLIQSYASTPWMQGALRQCGFSRVFEVDFYLRDRERLLLGAGTVPFHLSYLEADYAFTP